MSDHSDQDGEKLETHPKFEDYSNMDRTQIPHFEKLKGTECFKSGDYFEATKHYSKAVMAYQFLIKDGVVSDIEEIQKLTQEIYLPCNLNLAICYIKQKDYQMGRDFAKKALEVDANNLKALYRRGICLLNLQEFKAAGEDFKKVLELDPSNEDAKQAWEQLVKKKKATKQKQKAMSEKMLNSLDYQDKIESTPNQQSSQKLGWFKSKFEWLKNIFCMRKKKKQ